MLEIFDVFQLVSVYNTPASKETSCWTSVTKLFVFDPASMYETDTGR